MSHADPPNSEVHNQQAQSQPFRLDGRSALVTGGASGIGEATVKELARAGARVWIADINVSAAEALAASLPGTKAMHLDVTSAASIAAAATQIDRLINVNVRSVFLVTRAFLPLLFAAQTAGGNNGRGHTGTIVNIASVAGLVGIRQRFAYCTTKGAVIAMTRQLAIDYPKTLRINAICPGTVETPFVEGYLEKFHKDTKEETRAELRARQPMGRMGQPEEIASMVRYLASDEAAFISGSLLTIDGGLTAA
ncbi:MAG: SDR family oxidoreductase [Terracidiphilus sp.]